MPARHISPQSFDDVLSELGDDPAIPDPHGIRKTSPPPRVDRATQGKASMPSFSAKSFELKGPHMRPILFIIGLLFICTAGFFLYFEPTKSEGGVEIHHLQNQLSTLKEEFEASQNELASEVVDLYEAIDELEVSIHSLNLKTPAQAKSNRPVAIPHEAELRRWRYLGITRMGPMEQAFFNTGKLTLTVQKNEPVLGEWRLTQADKEMATLTHPKGKSITLKSAQSESVQ